MATAEKAPTRILLRNVTASYPSIVGKPKQNTENKLWQYGMTFVLPKDDPFGNVDKINAAIRQVLLDKFGADGPALLGTSIKNPLHVGDGALRDGKDLTKYRFDPATFQGWIAARTPAKEDPADCVAPQIAHPYADQSNPDKPALMTEHEAARLIYPGTVVNATVSFYFYDKKSKGVGVGLSNVQRVKDGPRLDSKSNAADDFVVLSDEDQIAALMG